MELDIALVLRIMSKSQSLKRKLSLSYIAYLFVFIFFIGIISNFIVQKQFRDYAKTKQENKLTQIVQSIENIYQDSWNGEMIEWVGMYELNNGYILTVTDENNQVIWDANYHHGHRCQMIINEIIDRMKSNNPNWNGRYLEKDFLLTNQDNEIVGKVVIGFLSPYFYTEDDVSFLQSLNTLYFIALLIFVIIALIMGQYMSRHIANPLYHVVQATKHIAKGNYDKINNHHSSIIEINDLTESVNQLSNTLMTQGQLRKQLTSDVTHELRTPLATLQGHIEAMIDGILEANQENLQSIYEEIIRLNNIVSDLDKLSRYDNKIYDLHIEKVNIIGIIHNVLNLFKSQIIAKNINVHFKEENIYLYVDKYKMGQVFINLISNALKYTPEGNDIFIKVIEVKNEVKIIIIDTGIGISKIDLPHIFERFYRVDKSRNRLTGGSGIGLSIVKSIIEAHKGRISVDSDIGKGTRIIITLSKIEENP